MSLQPGFFDMSARYEALSKFGDPLEKLAQFIDFEVFRKPVERSLQFSRRTGRPPYDVVLMVKILVLQSLYNLSDDQVEYQIKDRLSFMRFLGLSLHSRVPDAKTVWLYRERLSHTKVMHTIFKAFDTKLREHGYIAMSGQIVDASIIEAPRQRMTKAEKETIKEGKTPEGWNAHKAAQKDVYAKWQVKHTKAKPTSEGTKSLDLAIPSFGYKNHVSIDKKHGIIRTYVVTDAARFDGKELSNLLDSNNTSSKVWADSAYRSEANEDFMERHGFTSEVHRKKPRNKPMPQHIQRANGKKSKVRAPVEHVFAHLKQQQNLFIRTIGIKRAWVKIGLANLVYNMKRFIFLEKRVIRQEQCA